MARAINQSIEHKARATVEGSGIRSRRRRVPALGQRARAAARRICRRVVAIAQRCDQRRLVCALASATTLRQSPQDRSVRRGDGRAGCIRCCRRMPNASRRSTSRRRCWPRQRCATRRCLPSRPMSGACRSPASSFDVVVSNSTLDHFETRDEILTSLRGFHRILRPGGRLLLTMDNLANPAVALRNALPYALLRRSKLVAYPIGATAGPGRLRRMLKDAGLRRAGDCRAAALPARAVGGARAALRTPRNAGGKGAVLADGRSMGAPGALADALHDRLFRRHRRAQAMTSMNRTTVVDRSPARRSMRWRARRIRPATSFVVRC